MFQKCCYIKSPFSRLDNFNQGNLLNELYYKTLQISLLYKKVSSNKTGSSYFDMYFFHNLEITLEKKN